MTAVPAVPSSPTANDRLKARWPSVLWASVTAAVVIHALVFALWPTTVVDGVPMGFAPGRAGAVAAGLSFARFNQALVEMSEPQAAAARRAMGTEEAARDLADDVVDRLGQIRAR
ncbi:MAG: hypothetical protein KY453_09420, partial [Gemmatimonadetes bacterium]|nr:hypothetical protein [Gemmatimonadota bacterium]